MYGHTISAGRWEFYLPDLDNHVLVEVREEEVLVRATRDNVPERRKSCFIRHLAAEGCIPEYYQWQSEPGSGAGSSLKWIQDQSWLKLDSEHSRRAIRQVLRLILGAGLLLATMMAVVFLTSR